jgi:tape measure domain-containing protein
MNTIAQLQIRIETSGAKEGGTQLHKLSVEGKQTEATMRSLERINKTLEASYRQQTNQIRATAKQTEVLRDKTFNLVRVNNSAASATRRHTRSLKSFIPSSIAAAVSIGGLTYAAKQYVDSNIDVERSMVRIRNTLNFVTGDAKKAEQEFGFLTKTARAYGQDLQTLSIQYGKFAAAAKGTRLQGEPLHRLFEGMSAAAVTLGLNAEEAEGSFQALEQIMSKGQVSMEELRRQLGNRMPGAFRMAADALGVTTAELEKLVAKGVDSTKFLLAFEKGLNKTFNNDIANKTDTLTGSINRLRTEYFLLMSNNNSELVKSLSGTFDSISDTIKDPGFQSSVAAFSKMLGTMIEVSGKTFGAVFGDDGLVGNIKSTGLIDLLEKEQRKMAELRADPLGNDLVTQALSRDQVVLQELKRRRENLVGMSEFDKTLVDQSIAILEQRIKANEATARVAGEVSSLGAADSKDYSLASTRGFIDEGNKLKKKSLSFFEDPESEIELLKMKKQEELDFLREHSDQLFADKAAQRQRELELEEQYFEKIKGLQKEAAEYRIKGLTGNLGDMRDYFGELSVIAQGENRKLFEANKAFAIADATVKGVQAVQASASIGFPQNIPGILMETARAATSIAAISSTQFAGGRAAGGPVSAGTPYMVGEDGPEAFIPNVAGKVMNQRQMREASNGVGSSGSMKVVINNNASNASVQADRGADGSLVVTIVERAVRQTKAELAAEFTRGDGPNARAIEGPLLKRAGAVK